MGYCTKANAAAISGVAETDINSYQVTSVDNYIESLLGRNFGVENSHTHYYDIAGDEKGLELPHNPIISVTRLRDNQRDSNYQDMIEDTDFTVDKAAGILKLIKDEWNILKGSTGFTKGTKTVRIDYKWGFLTIPNEVSLFADWMLAWVAEIKKVTDASKTVTGAVLSSVQIGDYREAYSSGNKMIDSKYKDLLADMTSLLVSKYKFWGEADGDYFTSF